MSSKEKQSQEPVHHVLEAEPGDFRVTLNLITAISTTANASFDKLVGEFSKRISDKAATVFDQQ